MSAPICNWCGEDLVDMRRHAEYCDSSCRGKATHWRQSRSGESEKTLGSASPPPIQAIREDQEAAKAHWSMIAREGIIEVLKATGAYHADDLDHLDIPDEHRNIIGSQTAKLVNQKWIEEVGRRKSILPSRNGAKSGIYRLTALGKNKIAGVGDGEVRPIPTSRAIPHSGEAGLTGPGSGAGSDTSQESPALNGGPPSASTASPDIPPTGVSAGLPARENLEDGDEAAGVHSGGSSASVGSSPCADAEPAQLFSESSYEKMQDSDARAA